MPSIVLVPSIPPTFCSTILNDPLEELLLVTKELQCSYAASRRLTPMVTQPTRGAKILDMLLSSNPNIYKIKVVASSVNIDHRAVVASTTAAVIDRSKRGWTRIFCMRSRTNVHLFFTKEWITTPPNCCLYLTPKKHGIILLSHPRPTGHVLPPSSRHSYL